MDACPTLEALELFLAEGSADDAVRRHLQDCQLCKSTLRRVESNNELLTFRVRPMRERLAADCGYAGSSAVEGYTIVRPLQRGGQGAVFEAQQTSTGRRVALKILLEGAFFGTRERKRFEREVELVVGLRHPNIVSVFDCGETKDGRPYLAMEMIEGHPLDVFLQRRREAGDWSLERTLRQFVKICGAVGYAHQRTVIHRDLKPGNILVDMQGEPQVLDFGLAKTLSGDEASLTLSREFMGTLAYASPEQVRGGSGAVDTRADVYSLGVILYEMLTGSPPYPDTERMADLVRAITELEPRAPSACLAGSRTGSRLFRRLRMSGDEEIDVITLKALEKDPERRYQTAGELGRDVEHVLAGDPIEARRDSTWYLVRKTVQRHRVPFAAAVSVFLVVLASSIGMAVLWRGSVRAADREAHEAQVAGSAVDFVNELFASIEPSTAQGREPTVREVLDIAVERVGTELVGPPELEAEVRLILGRAFRSISLAERALPHIERAHELTVSVFDPPDTAIVEAAHELALTHVALGQYVMALSIWDEVERDLSNLGSKAELLTARVAAGRARVYVLQGELELAQPLFARAIAIQRELLGQDHLQVIATEQDLANVLLARGDHERGAESLLAVVEHMERIGKGQHMLVATSLRNVASSLVLRGEYEQALPHAERAREVFELLLGEEHPEASSARAFLAVCTLRMNQRERARELYERSLEDRARLEDSATPEAGLALHSLGVVAHELGYLADAEALLRASISVQEGLEEGGRPKLAKGRIELSKVLAARGEHAAAARVAREALDELVLLGAFRDPAARSAHFVIGSSHYQQKDFREALEHGELSLDLSARFFGERSLQVGEASSLVGACLSELGRYEEANRHLSQALAIKRELFGDEQTRTLFAWISLARSLVRARRHDDAQLVLGELLAIPSLSEQYRALAMLLLGEASTASGELEQAGFLLFEARESLQTLTADRSDLQAECERALGEWHLARGEHESAEEALERALELARRAHGPEHPAVGRVLLASARLRVALGEPREALARLVEGAAVIETSRGPEHFLALEMRALAAELR